VTVVQADALSWFASHTAEAHTSAITSLPDQSELAAVSFSEWQAWFVQAARTLLHWLPEDGTAIFYQRDVRRAGQWVDKSQLILDAARAESFQLVWHKIVCRRAADTTDPDARPGYSHLLCLHRNARAPRRPLPDVLTNPGPGSWTRAMGLTVCQLACDHLRHETTTRTVIDPFCGRGGVLAVAAAIGFDVIGIELHARRARATRTLLARTRIAQIAVEHGAALFDRGQYFEAHEAWEERWRQSRDASERLGLQGLIQIAAAFHKWFVMSSPESAQRLLDKGRQKLAAVCWLPGIDLSALQRELDVCADTIATGSFTRERAPRLQPANE
jgi:hypothetical protein